METIPSTLQRRQIWATPSPTSSSLPPTCTPFILPSGGLMNVGSHTILTLTQDAAFQPPCAGTPVPQPIDPLQPGVDLSVLNYTAPFYSSTNPQIYAVAAVTVVSYMLVTILFITPRTFYLGGGGVAGSLLGRRPMVGGAYGSNSVIGIGSRPWLQKMAAVTVAASLTIVTADTLKWAKHQYNDGYEDADEISQNVNGGLEIRIVSVIAETCLWLAQAQTLIRLFPRHKEKIVIKWTAFGLILLELIFSILNHFVDGPGQHPPKKFADAIPALNYLFALALNLCYLAFVTYYALCKRRFAFWHPNMRSMPLVSLLSLTAVLIPVIFFILDLSKPDVSGWGTYVRWVGAAAASVVVWEWVERIEALERDEKKDGILGREIFDGDEMLEATPSVGLKLSNSGRINNARGDKGGGTLDGCARAGLNHLTAMANQTSRKIARRQPIPETKPEKVDVQTTKRRAVSRSATDAISAIEPGRPTRPVPVASPISRADTTSAASTDYVVRYHPPSEPTPPMPEESDLGSSDGEIPREHEEPVLNAAKLKAPSDRNTRLKNMTDGLARVQNPFKRRRTSPPLEVQEALPQNPATLMGKDDPRSNTSLLERIRLKRKSRPNQTQRPVIVVPAPPRIRLSFESARDEHEVQASAQTSVHTRYYQPGETELDAIVNSRSGSPICANSRLKYAPAGTIGDRLSQRGTLQIVEPHRPPDDETPSHMKPKSQEASATWPSESSRTDQDR